MPGSRSVSLRQKDRGNPLRRNDYVLGARREQTLRITLKTRNEATKFETYKRDLVNGGSMVSTSPLDFVRERVVYADTFEL